MKKLLALALLSLAAVTSQAAPYTCKDLPFVEYEIEDLAEHAVDVQFNTATRISILDEYYVMIGERELLRKNCIPNYPGAYSKEFTSNGTVYMVVEESDSRY